MAQSGVLRVPRVQLIRGLARTKETVNLSAASQQSLPHVSSKAGRHPGDDLIPTRVKADSFQGFQNGASSESCPSASATGPMHDAQCGLVLGLEPEQPNRCEGEWGEPASQGSEPGSGVIWEPGVSRLLGGSVSLASEYASRGCR